VLSLEEELNVSKDEFEYEEQVKELKLQLQQKASSQKTILK